MGADEYVEYIITDEVASPLASAQYYTEKVRDPTHTCLRLSSCV